MAIQIRISPDALRSAAEQYKGIDARIDETQSRLKVLSMQLHEAWEGAAGDKAVDTLDDLSAVTRRCESSVQEAVGYLESVARVFETIDSGESISPFAAKMVNMADIHKIIGMPMPQLVLSFIGSIRIIPDEVRNIANQCRQIADTYFEMRDESQKILNVLLQEWEGNSCNRFVEGNELLGKALITVAEELTEFADKISKIAERYEEIDNSFNF